MSYADRKRREQRMKSIAAVAMVVVITAIISGAALVDTYVMKGRMVREAARTGQHTMVIAPR